jgi:subtilisin family serine protease
VPTPVAPANSPETQTRSRRVRHTLYAFGGLALVCVSLAATAIASSSSDWRDKVDASVLSAAQLGSTEFFVYLEPKADLSGAEGFRTREAKSRFVHQRLTAVAEASQGPVAAHLDQLGAEHRGFWITNAIVAQGGLAVVQAMASRPDVAHVYGLGAGKLDPPMQVDLPGGTTAVTASPQVFDSIAKVNADDAWALGYRGQGAVVAGADTGVRWTHEALKTRYRGWNGSTASHDYSWHDAIHVQNPGNPCPASGTQPCDDDVLLGGGHGTHTVGTMVGSGQDRLGQKNGIGMAPDAKWIACRNMNHGLGIVPTYLECMQWFLAPTRIDGTGADPSKAPDVVNNSWGCVEGCPPPALQDSLQASRAAGIVYAVSAGNDGVGGPPPASGCSTIYHPLARYPEAFTVGSTTWTTDTISSFSSRGPVVLGDVPGSLLLAKPNVTAPGSAVRSALRATDSSYGSLSGTSMAGPHVAGLVALVISANPALRGDVDEIESIIEQTAVDKPTNEGCGGDTATQVPNNTYGWGRIDALAAVNLAVSLRSPVDVLDAAFDEIDAMIAADPSHADKLEDVRAQLETAVAELRKTPPARQAALGAIEGAVGEIEAAVSSGDLTAAQGASLTDRITGAARQLAVDAIEEARDGGGNAAKIAEAERALAEGDALRASAPKAAVNKYKDAAGKAEGA